MLDSFSFWVSLECSVAGLTFLAMVLKLILYYLKHIVTVFSSFFFGDCLKSSVGYFIHFDFIPSSGVGFFDSFFSDLICDTILSFFFEFAGSFYCDMPW